MLRSICLFALAATATTSTASAFEWNGEGTLSAGFSSGNSNTSDAGVGVKTKRDGIDWRTAIEAKLDYGETNGVESKNRLFFATQADRKFSNDIWSAYGRTSYESNEIAGLDRRVFLGMGMGYTAIQDDTTSWSVEGSPGFKLERRISRGSSDPIYIENDTLAIQAGSRFSHRLNDHVKISNDTNVIYSDASTQIINDLSLTAALVENISARVSWDVRHDTAPLTNVEPTDTTTRISLVYGFGG